MMMMSEIQLRVNEFVSKYALAPNVIFLPKGSGISLRTELMLPPGHTVQEVLGMAVIDQLSFNEIRVGLIEKPEGVGARDVGDQQDRSSRSLPEPPKEPQPDERSLKPETVEVEGKEAVLERYFEHLKKCVVCQDKLKDGFKESLKQIEDGNFTELGTEEDIHKFFHPEGDE